MKKTAKPAPAEKTEYTVTEAAEVLGCSRASVGRQVRALGLGRMIARIHILSPADIAILHRSIRIEPGNPGSKSPGLDQPPSITDPKKAAYNAKRRAARAALRKEKPVPVVEPAARKAKKPKGKT